MSKERTAINRLRKLVPKGSQVFYMEGERLLDKPYHFKKVGLPEVYLFNGVKTEIDPDHGRLVTIENFEGLLTAIGLQIVQSGRPMTGAEFRFLRQRMHLTQSQLGKRIGVTDQTIAHYEKETTTSPIASAAVRLHYLISILPRDAKNEILQEAILEAQKDHLQIAKTPRQKISKGWQPELVQAAA